MLDRRTVSLKEQVIVIDESGAHHLATECKVASKHFARSRTEHDRPIITCLRGRSFLRTRMHLRAKAGLNRSEWSRKPNSNAREAR